MASHPCGAATSSVSNEDRYSEQQTSATYSRLKVLAETLLGAGYSVIVDATFLRRAQREEFKALARALNAPFKILACTASEPILRDRIQARSATGGDPSEATQEVLTRQLATLEPLTTLEQTDLCDEAVDG